MTRPIDVSQPLAKHAQLRLRKYYKIQTGLPKNARIQRILESLGIATPEEGYAVMANMYNASLPVSSRVVRTVSEEVRLKRNKQARDRRAAKKTAISKVVYIAHLKLKIEYTKSFYENEEGVRYGVGDVVYKEETTLPNTASPADIPKIIATFDNDDGYKITTLESYDIEIMDTTNNTQHTKNSTDDETSLRATQRLAQIFTRYRRTRRQERRGKVRLCTTKRVPPQPSHGKTH